ncbi:MAG: Kef-type K+ transport system membrane component KefB [Myxococcota bacterium]|jgi:Kef-type K+ transport system membrane component KefB
MTWLRRIFVLALLIATIFAMHELQVRVTDVSTALTFAAIGFVVLAAYAMAELVSGIGLPRVTGYILAGIGLGPSAAALMGLDPPILSGQIVEDMGVFNSLALALIALEAGLELSLDAMRRFKKTLASIILFKIPLSWIMVGGGFVALASTLLPLPHDTDTTSLIAIGLILGALGVGTSPAVSIAVISETGSKSKTADLILGFAVFKDVVMVVMLAIALAIASVLLDPTASFDSDILVALGKKIVFSIGFGVAIGGALIAWMKWVRWENILMLLVVAYAVNTLSDVLHLKALLVFIAAGFTVANFSSYGHDLHKPLGLLALPVFVIFFTTAGAGLPLEPTIAVLPLAGSLFAIRGAMMFVSTRLGGRLAGEKPAFSNNLWLGFISQAGVALVLLNLALEELNGNGHTTLATDLGQVAFALIALNLLIGPVLLRIALGKADALEAPAENGNGSETGPSRRARPTIVPPAVPPGEAELNMLHNAMMLRVKQSLGEAKDAAQAWADQARLHMGKQDYQGRLTQVMVSPHAARLRAAARASRDLFMALPVKHTAPIEPHHRSAAAAGSWTARMGSIGWRLRTALGAKRRTVPVRATVRSVAEAPLTTELADFLDALALAEAHRLSALDAGLRQGRDDDATPTALAEDVVTAQLAMLQKRLDDAGELIDRYLAHGLRFAGTPHSDARSLRFHRVAADVEDALKRLDARGDAWDVSVGRVARRVQLRAQLLASEHAIEQHSTEALARWSTDHKAVVEGLFEIMRQALDKTQFALSELKLPVSPERAQASADAIIAGLDRVVGDQILPVAHDLRVANEASPLKTLEEQVAAAVPETADELDLAPVDLDLSAVEKPSDLVGERKAVADTVEKYLAGELTWSLAETRAEDEDLVARVTQRLSEVAGAATVGLRAGIAEIRDRGGDEETVGAEILGFARDTITRVHRLLVHTAEDATTSLDAVPRHIIASNDDAFVRVYARLLGEPGAPDDGREQRRTARLRATVGRAGKHVRGLADRVGAKLSLAYRRIVRGEMANRARLQNGSIHADPSRMARDVLSLEPAQSVIEHMPYVLARLFTPSTLDTHHLLTGVESQVAAIHTAHTRFMGGTPSAILIRGAAGSGKTSMARVTLRTLEGRRLVDVVLTPDHRHEGALCEAIGTHADHFEARTFKALESALKSGPRRVLLLDGFEQLFVRSPESLRVVRGLLGLVAATREKVLWVISIDEPTACLLEPLCDLPAYFTDHLALRPLAAGELGQLLEARARLAGFDVQWPDDPRGRSLSKRISRRPATESDQRKRFLAQLELASGGNIRDALTLFINAIDEVNTECIRLRPIQTQNFAWFDQLGRDAHRLLATIIVSGSLSEREATMALLWPIDRLRAAKARLSGAQLVVSVGNARFKVRPYAWRRVTAALESRNQLAVTSHGLRIAHEQE